MIVTSNIPNGSGRVRMLSPDAVEIELIAFSKGARYFCVEISQIEEEREVEVILIPDRLFRIPTFVHKFHADVWLREEGESCWERVRQVERTPERVRCCFTVQPGQRYLLSSEPPYRYTETTEELYNIAHRFPHCASVHCLGHSMEHRPIMALRVSEQPVMPGQETLPVIHIVAGEHASESAGEEIARGMLQLVLSPAGADLRRDFIFDFILTANPDGNYHGWHQYNLRDWREHSYADEVDRSWHHEFLPYMQGLPMDYSPETIALMEWMKLTRPAFYFSMHSWEGHNGAPGAFHAHPDELTPEMGIAVTAITEWAKKISAGLGFPFHAFPSPGDSLHLGQFLMRQQIAIAYLPEGNYAVGRENLQRLGAGLLMQVLNDPRIPARTLDRSRWDLLASAELSLQKASL